VEMFLGLKHWNGIYDAGASPGVWETWENILYDESH